MAKTARSTGTRKRAVGEESPKPLVVITGAAGSIGSALVAELEGEYTVVGLDREGKKAACELFPVDLSSRDSVALALERLGDAHGRRISSVIHLAAYFDFTGDENPLYEKVNVEGTRYLLQALRDFEVGQFVYSGTMLVHRPDEPGRPIDEDAPIEPKWAYPISKAKAEEVIREEHGDIPFVLLHLAGLYDEKTAVPTLSEQIRRIYERDPKAHAYSGSLDVGQAFLHKEDMIDAFVRTVERREELPSGTVILIGEPETASYDELQRRIGFLIHGEKDWTTLTLPKPLAAMGAWLEEKSEPIVPDDFDQGEEPFIRPFMVAMADDHYELDITRARALLGWQPKHSILATLPATIAFLKSDPMAWYEANRLTPPHWLQDADERVGDAEALRLRAEREFRREHRRFLWAPMANVALGVWLVASPPTLGYQSAAMMWSDVLSGIAVMLLASLTLSWRLALVRWVVAALGVWVMAAPLFFWAPTAGAYLNGTLVGALVFAFAVVTRPAPGVGIMAATTGPTIPPGWDYSPSDWFQRLPIIMLAVVGLLLSRYMAAYQLGHIDGVWDPFFAGALDDPQNGTEEVITSAVSEAWPVPDAGVGALVYVLEILTGVIGSSRRWRTMPWLVVAFGILIVPLGIVSITFIIIQPIVIGTWCTICLIAAAAMLIQIPYSVDELIATCQFLLRRKRAGSPILRVFLFGDTDEGRDERSDDDFERSPVALAREMVSGGISVPWTLAASALVGIWLMFTHLTLGAEGVMADSDHLIGALVLTVSITALAETARAARFLNVLFGMALTIMPFIAAATLPQTVAGILAGLLLIALSLPRGPVRNSYGSWDRVIV